MKLCLNCHQSISHDDWDCDNCSWSAKQIEGFLAFDPQLASSNNNYNADSFLPLYNLENNNFWFNARNRLINFMLQKHFPKAQNFFELGCGTGFVLNNIHKNNPTLQLYASDIYIEALRFSAKRLDNRATLFQMNGLNIPFEDEFDVIGAFDLLEHIEDDKAVLANIYKAVKPKGGVLITVPQHKILWSKADELACHKRRYQKGELEKKLIDVGFQIAFSTSFVSLLLPLMLISRLTSQKKYNYAKELDLNSTLNSILEKILNFETSLIKLSLRFPIGGSRFIVGKKL